MKFSPLAKIGLAFGALVAFLLFLIVVDLGVNAGRIHYGVSVAGVDLGGMTRVEATRELTAKAKELDEQVILLTAEGLNDGIQPSQLGWEPKVPITVRNAYDVGREDAPFGALSDRVGSWLWGTKVDLSGSFDRELLHDQIVEWDERLSGFGRPIDRQALRALLRKAVAEGDTGPFDFPVREPR